MAHAPFGNRDISCICTHHWSYDTRVLRQCWHLGSLGGLFAKNHVWLLCIISAAVSATPCPTECGLWSFAIHPYVCPPRMEQRSRRQLRLHLLCSAPSSLHDGSWLHYATCSCLKDWLFDKIHQKQHKSLLRFRQFAFFFSTGAKKLLVSSLTSPGSFSEFDFFGPIFLGTYIFGTLACQLSDASRDCDKIIFFRLRLQLRLQYFNLTILSMYHFPSILPSVLYPFFSFKKFISLPFDPGLVPSGGLFSISQVLIIMELPVWSVTPWSRVGITGRCRKTGLSSQGTRFLHVCLFFFFLLGTCFYVCYLR